MQKKAIIADFMEEKIKPTAPQSDEEWSQKGQAVQPFKRMETPVKVNPLDQDLNDRMRRAIQTMKANNVDLTNADSSEVQRTVREMARSARLQNTEKDETGAPAANQKAWILSTPPRTTKKHSRNFTDTDRADS